MKLARLLLISMISVISAGCANNMLAGVGAGALFGAAVGNSTEAAKNGAILGGVIGSMIPNQPQGQVLAQQPVAPVGGLSSGWSCPAGSAWDGRGCRRLGGVVQTFPTFPTAEKGMCNNPYQVNQQGQVVFNGRHPC